MDDRISQVLSPFERITHPFWVSSLFSLIIIGVIIMMTPLCPSPTSDTWDYAQLARNIHRGTPYISQFTYPIMLEWNGQPPFHTCWRLPVYPLLGSLLFWVDSTPSIQLFIFLALGFQILLTGVTGLLAGRIVGRKSGYLAGCLVALSTPLLQNSLEGLSEPFFILIFLLGLVLLVEGTTTTTALAGLVFGITWLTRSNLILFLPGLTLFLLLEQAAWKERFIRFMLLFGIIGLVCTPWWYRNMVVTGNPFFNMSSYLPVMFTETWPGWTLFRTVPPFENGLPQVDFKMLWSKLLEHLWEFGIVSRLMMVNPLLWGLGVWGCWIAWQKRKAQPRMFQLGCLLLISEIIHVIFLCAVEPSLRLYSPMIPLFILLAVAGLHEVRQINIKKSIAIILLLLMLVPLGRYGYQRSEIAWSVLSDYEIQEIKKTLPTDGILISDQADYLAWTLDREILWLPTLNTFPKLQHKNFQARLLHLSPNLSDLLSGEGAMEQGWMDPESRKTLGVGELLYQTQSGHTFYKISFNK